MIFKNKVSGLSPNARSIGKLPGHLTTVGDPETPLRWTCKRLMHLSRQLRAQGHTISHVSVGALLKEMGYGLQGNRKTLEGSTHPDRNAQFEFINQKADAALLAGEPVISVNTPLCQTTCRVYF